ncbi:MAG: DNA repair protein RecN [Deltaproteobacteria bacterium]|nr:DNA repair protein RecN [Deltaproteobacteria bacterium]
MLLELRIKDFAIIEGLNVSFGPGLNIFTGETGAGKSIILDAIALILGDRASNDIIRANKDEAQVEALFDITGNRNLGNVLKEAGIEAAKELVIKRVIQKAGRNRIYINGGLATLVTLTEVGRRLIDIYGQSEHQSLTRPEEHVEVLDAFGDFGKLRDYMAECHRAYASIKKEYDSLTSDSKSSEEKRELLAFQLKEIEDAAISPGEDAELKKLKEKLQNSEKIKAVTAEAERGLYSDPGSVIERLGGMIKALKEMAKVDDKLAKTADALEASLFQLEDSERFLRDYSDSIEADPEALEKVAGRLDHVIKIKRKYGPEIEDVLGRKASFEKELKNLSNFEERLKALDSSVKAAREKAATAANNLSEARKAAAREFEAKVQEELATLGMKGSVFEVAIDAEKNPDGSPRFGEKGSDRVSFFISTNPGEGIKPLARIASGGELSRIMLSMKSVTASGRVPTLIFDEIDNGVGGAMAQVVGMKLKEVARSNQVLAITHLPQVAAFADRHYNVAKQAQSGRTVTSVRELSKEESVEHISFMLGGMKVTDTSRKQAMELMEAARSLSAGKTSARKGK